MDPWNLFENTQSEIYYLRKYETFEELSNAMDESYIFKISKTIKRPQLYRI